LGKINITQESAILSECPACMGFGIKLVSNGEQIKDYSQVLGVVQSYLKKNKKPGIPFPQKTPSHPPYDPFRAPNHPLNPNNPFGLTHPFSPNNPNWKNNPANPLSPNNPLNPMNPHKPFKK